MLCYSIGSGWILRSTRSWRLRVAKRATMGRRDHAVTAAVVALKRPW